MGCIVCKKEVEEKRIQTEEMFRFEWVCSSNCENSFSIDLLNLQDEIGESYNYKINNPITKQMIESLILHEKQVCTGFSLIRKPSNGALMSFKKNNDETLFQIEFATISFEDWICLKQLIANQSTNIHSEDGRFKAHTLRKDQLNGLEIPFFGQSEITGNQYSTYSSSHVEEVSSEFQTMSFFYMEDIDRYGVVVSDYHH
ncbi:hypothetical protein [Chengkuizengella sediminis]|uniref:hypothetical protein n=1 Tax=Chengkuizengella sediminis TaxID=1885917 RepID=UPI001389DE22|nr:hypothetical protein [Chengkuizengella sediminis]